MISVVIPYYQGATWIERCIASLNAGSVVPDFIIIVDNDPMVTPVSIGKPASNIIIIKTRPHTGFGRACNTGIQKAIDLKSEHIVLLNQDTYVQSTALENLISVIKGHDGNTMCVPITYEYDSETCSEHFTRRTLNQTTYIHDQKEGNHSESYPITVANAACLAFNVSTFKEIGFFDPVFFMYGEDDDLFQRLFISNGTLLLAANAHIHHAHTLATTISSRKDEAKKMIAWSSNKLFIRYQAKSLLHYWGHMAKRAIKDMFKLKFSRALIEISMTVSHTFMWNKIRDNSKGTIQNRALRFINSDMKGSNG